MRLLQVLRSLIADGVEARLTRGEEISGDTRSPVAVADNRYIDHKCFSDFLYVPTQQAPRPEKTARGVLAIMERSSHIDCSAA